LQQGSYLDKSSALPTRADEQEQQRDERRISGMGPLVFEGLVDEQASPARESGKRLMEKRHDSFLWPVVGDAHHDDGIRALRKALAKEVARMNINAFSQGRIVAKELLGFFADLWQVKEDGLQLRILRDQGQTKPPVTASHIQDPPALGKIPILRENHSWKDAGVMHEGAITGDLPVGRFKEIRIVLIYRPVLKKGGLEVTTGQIEGIEEPDVGTLEIQPALDKECLR